MKYVYPAVFTPLDDGEYDVYVPDLPYCRTCGYNLAEAVEMGVDAVSMWLWDAENKDEIIPPASISIDCIPPQFISFLIADTDAYRIRHDSKAVKKTLTIPSWLNEKATKEGINFSVTLKDALIAKIAK